MEYTVVTATFFGKTKKVRAGCHNMKPTDDPDEILWIESPTDEYALMSSQLQGKKIALVYRHDWLKAKTFT